VFKLHLCYKDGLQGTGCGQWLGKFEKERFKKLKKGVTTKKT